MSSHEDVEARLLSLLEYEKALRQFAVVLRDAGKPASERVVEHAAETMAASRDMIRALLLRAERAEAAMEKRVEQAQD
jgi:hypothetical protein